FPAVIRAAQAAFLVLAEPQRDAAMGAELLDEADAALRIAERHQLLAEQPHAHRRTVRLLELASEQRRHPVAAEQVAHERAGTGLGQQPVAFGAPVRHVPFRSRLRACAHNPFSAKPKLLRTFLDYRLAG